MLTAIIFEGGGAKSLVEQQLLSVRKAVALDNMEKLVRLPQYERVILCTNYPDLAEQARELGVVVEDTTQGAFHFGEALQDLIRRYGIKKALYFGGASSPLLTEGEFARIAEKVMASDQIVYTNNVQSADIVAWSPAEAILTIEPPVMDNVLAGELRYQAGLPQVLMPHSVGIHFDIDTPTELLFLKVLPGVGPRTKAALDALDLDVAPLLRAKAVLASKSYAETFIYGRVGAPIIAHLNSNLALRLRVYSEERGMKALGRIEKGQVTSFIGDYIEHLGIEAFFSYLTKVCQVAFVDTRVIFSHFKLNPSESDRFNSDLGNWQLIQDPFIREFTKRAVEASIPVILGGHTLVLGGLWALVDTIKRERGEAIR